MAILVLVTGGTGFVGREVVAQLHAAGHRVRLLVRDKEKAAAFAKKHDAELVLGDVAKAETLAPAVAGVDAIIHLVGIIKETATATFEEVHTEGTKSLLRAAIAGQVKRFVLMSALGVRAEASSRYHQSKWLAEEAVRASGLDWTIFRPSIIYGPGDKSLNIIALLFRWPVDFLNLWSLPLPGGGVTKVQPIAVEEVGRCFVRSFTQPESIKQVYDLAGPKAVTWREIICMLARVHGKGTPEDDPGGLRLLVRCGLWLLMMATPIMGLLLMAVDGAPSLDPRLLIIMIPAWMALVWWCFRWRTFLLYRVPGPLLAKFALAISPHLSRPLQMGEQVKMLQEDNVGDPEPAAKTFDFKPQELESGLRLYLPRKSGKVE